MRDVSETVPKPMVPIGNRPILWHVMKYYAHFGFTDFVLCLGYKAEVDQAVLPHLRRGDVERLRAHERRREGPPAEDRHPRLEHHVRRHRPARVIGERLHAVRHLLRDDEYVPRELRRHPDRRRPARDDRRAPGTRADGELPRGAAELQLPRRLDGADGRVSEMQRRDAVRYLDQRRLLRPQPETSWINLRPGEELVEEPLRSACSPPARCSRSDTKGSGPRWTP